MSAGDMSTGDMSTPATRRGLGPWPWVLLLAGTVGAFATAAQPWWRAPYPGGTVPVPGNEAAGALPTTLAAVLAAGLLLALTLRGWGRFVLAVLLALVALGVVALGLAAPDPDTEVVSRLAQAVTLDRPGPPVRAWGGYGFAGAGLLALLGAVGVVLTARGTPRTGTDRFSRARSTEPVAADDDALSVWRALDDGQDPTSDDHTSTPISSPPDDEGTMGPERPHRHGRQR